MKALDILIPSALSIFPLIGLALMSMGGKNLWRAIASTRWPTTQGVVAQSETSTSVSRDRSTQAASVSYSAQIRFRYRAGGREYTTDLIRIGQTVGSGDSSEAELRRLRYPPGAAVTVSYNPDDPSIAVVKPGFHSEALWLPGAGLGFFLPGVMFFIMYYATAGERTSMLGVGLGLFAIIFMLIGLAMLSGGLRRLWRAWASQSWPVAEGVLLYGKQDSSTSVTKDEDGETQRSTSYGTHLVYRFEVDGQKHFSNTRRFGQLAGAGQDWAQEIAERYPVGGKVRVAYDPGDPDLAVLEPGVNSEAYWLPGAGAAFFLFGLAVMIWGIPALTRH